MNGSREITVRASPKAVYRLLAEVELWPALVPEYRAVRVIQRADYIRLVRVTSRLGPMPVTWDALQYLYPERGRVRLAITRGALRGMAVSWMAAKVDDGLTRLIVRCSESTVERTGLRGIPIDALQRRVMRLLGTTTGELIARIAEGGPLPL